MIYKILSVISIILTIVMAFLYFDLKNDNIRYEIRFIELNNSNFGENIEVIDYICSEGMKIDNIQSSGVNWFYASTWRDAKVHNGKCAIKVKVNR